MIDKFFDGVIEQVYKQVQRTQSNIAMACYSNDFSIKNLESLERYSKNKDDVFFAYYEFEHREILGAYAPFLDILCQVYRDEIGGDFSQFLEECNVYYMHRKLLEKYYHTGVCERNEPVLLDEVKYEQERMTNSMAIMLKTIATYKPIVVVINRFQLACKSTMELIYKLVESPTKNIGIVLGANESQQRPHIITECWEKLTDKIADNSQLYHLGSTGLKRNLRSNRRKNHFSDFRRVYIELNNMIEMLDLDYAVYYMQHFERRIKSGELVLSEEWQVKFSLLYVKASIFTEDLPKALELISSLANTMLYNDEHWLNFECAYYIAICYMYQGKLKEGFNIAETAAVEARLADDDELVFRAKLLKAQVQMSGWYNIFFCVNDVTIDDDLIDELIAHNYKNNLAHVYVYAFDNRPEIVAKAAESEELLEYFSKGIKLAMELDNEQLVYDAYQKNIMIASTNGMNGIAMHYSISTYNFIQDKRKVEATRIFVGLGYNLSALGYNDKAQNFYNRAIETFYELREAQDIAEVYYNLAINYIMKKEYGKAKHSLQFTMKAIERLHLNSLTVCNLSKLYALLALVEILQGQQFSCERNLLSCRQFLNYIIEKNKETDDMAIIHDYAMCDDDMFIYSFASALLAMSYEDDEKTFKKFDEAEGFLIRAEGNQFYLYETFKNFKIDFYEKKGRSDLAQRERESLSNYLERQSEARSKVSLERLSEIRLDSYSGPCCVAERELDMLVKQTGIEMDHKADKQHMEFMAIWQNLIDVSDKTVNELVYGAMRFFLNHFNNDQAVYIRYDENQQGRILFNNSKKRFRKKTIDDVARFMRNYSEGFAVSKISENFFEYVDIISIFGVDEVCSFVAIPFFNGSQLQGILMTYVMMKDNWHNSIDRYMLNQDDLEVYRLLFKELTNSINRIEANQKIYDMNKTLAKVAITDALTGLYNRAGMYSEAERIEREIHSSKENNGVAVMFIDLDNFKPYNDKFGHVVGDIVLQEIAQIFKNSVGENGVVCRFGGDEFIAILSTANRKELATIAERIYYKIDAADGFKERISNHLNAEYFEKTGKELPENLQIKEVPKIGCSIGIATSDNIDDKSINKMIEMADDMLYAIKINNKGTYGFI